MASESLLKVGATLERAGSYLQGRKPGITLMEVLSRKQLRDLQIAQRQMEGAARGADIHGAGGGLPPGAELGGISLPQQAQIAERQAEQAESAELAGVTPPTGEPIDPGVLAGMTRDRRLRSRTATDVQAKQAAAKQAISNAELKAKDVMDLDRDATSFTDFAFQLGYDLTHPNALNAIVRAMVLYKADKEKKTNPMTHVETAFGSNEFNIPKAGEPLGTFAGINIGPAGGYQLPVGQERAAQELRQELSPVQTRPGVPVAPTTPVETVDYGALTEDELHQRAQANDQAAVEEALRRGY